MQAFNKFIAHLDVDAFFASMEQRDDPSLRGRAVAVGTGVVASCSYEAKREGVKTGMSLVHARQLCRSLLVIPGDHRRYEQAGRQILGICREYSPEVEMPALDDLYMCLEDPDPGWQEKQACNLRGQILDEVGLRVSMGIGKNKLLANVATHHAKLLRLRMEQRGACPWLPGVRILAAEGQASPVVQVLPGQGEVYMRPWPVALLPGVGKVGAEKFDRLSIRSVGEVAKVPVDVLCAMFGKRGPMLRNYAMGKDDRPLRVEAAPLSVSRRSSFNSPTADQTFLLAMIDHLVERAISWARFHQLAAHGVRVFIRYGDHQECDGNKLFRLPESREEVLRNTAREIFCSLYVRRLPLRLVGVEFGRLGKPPCQPSLFQDPAQMQEERLCAVRDAVRQRFGFMSIVRGSSLLLKEKLSQDRDNFQLRTPCLNR